MHLTKGKNLKNKLKKLVGRPLFQAQKSGLRIRVDFIPCFQTGSGSDIIMKTGSGSTSFQKPYPDHTKTSGSATLKEGNTNMA